MTRTTTQPKKVRKTRKDKKSPEVRAKEKLEKKIKEAVEKEDLEAVERVKIKHIDPEFKLEEYTPSSFVIVLTPDGDIYSEPVPRYCEFMTFVNFLACHKDLPSNKNFDLRAQVSYTTFPHGIIVTNAFDGTRKSNPYASLFNIKNDTKAIGGNLVFSLEDRGYNKRELKKVSNYIIEQINKEDVICLE